MIYLGQLYFIQGQLMYVEKQSKDSFLKEFSIIFSFAKLHKKIKDNRQDTHFVRQNAGVLLFEATEEMKKSLEVRKTIRFEAELVETIEKLSEVSSDASDKEKSRQFSKVVRRLCRQALAENQAQDLDDLLFRLEATRRQIAPIGSNLNQIAAGFNQDGHLYGENLAGVHYKLQKQFAEMTKIFRELKNGLIKLTR